MGLIVSLGHPRAVRDVDEAVALARALGATRALGRGWRASGSAACAALLDALARGSSSEVRFEGVLEPGAVEALRPLVEEAPAYLDVDLPGVGLRVWPDEAWLDGVVGPTREQAVASALARAGAGELRGFVSELAPSQVPAFAVWLDALGPDRQVEAEVELSLDDVATLYRRLGGPVHLELTTPVPTWTGAIELSLPDGLVYAYALAPVPPADADAFLTAVERAWATLSR